MSAQPKPQHTPTPWSYRPAYSNGEPIGYVVQDGVTALADLSSDEDASQLVDTHNEACNSYETLRAKNERLKEEVELLKRCNSNSLGWHNEFTRLRADLTRLKAQNAKLVEAMTKAENALSSIYSEPKRYIDLQIHVRDELHAALASVEKEGQ